MALSQRALGTSPERRQPLPRSSFGSPYFSPQNSRHSVRRKPKDNSVVSVSTCASTSSSTTASARGSLSSNHSSSPGSFLDTAAAAATTSSSISSSPQLSFTSFTSSSSSSSSSHLSSSPEPPPPSLIASLLEALALDSLCAGSRRGQEVVVGALCNTGSGSGSRSRDGGDGARDGPYWYGRPSNSPRNRNGVEAASPSSPTPSSTPRSCFSEAEEQLADEAKQLLAKTGGRLGSLIRPGTYVSVAEEAGCSPPLPQVTAWKRESRRPRRKDHHQSRTEHGPLHKSHLNKQDKLLSPAPQPLQSHSGTITGCGRAASTSTVSTIQSAADFLL